jgi:hypothetical protein
VAALGLVASACGQQQDVTCLNSTQVRIVRVDDTQKRVFVITDLRQIGTAEQARDVLQELEDVLRKCRPSWEGSWSASFFKDAKFAGYKDEPQLQTFVADGSWTEAYVGEYERTSRTMTLMPATEMARKFVADGKQ